MKKFFTKHTLVIVVLIVIVIVALAGGLYYFYQYKKTQDLLRNPTLSSQVEQQTVVNKVGQLMDLPKDEQPTLATVTDVSKLKSQPFFNKAQNGFKVLIYTRAKEAILYDPVNNKIVEVAPVNIGQPSVTPAILKVALYNGTTTVGLTTTVEKELKQKVTNISIVQKTNAKSVAYTKTTVIDLTSKNAKAASELAQLLNGQTGALPEGEDKPSDADLLVILGSNK